LPEEKDSPPPHPSEERRRHKKKRLVQSPNSYFMDVKCIGCYRITTIFSHAHTVVACPGCTTILCTPGGGKCKLTAGGTKLQYTFKHLNANTALNIYLKNSQEIRDHIT
uniref:40S ribosomal protein S27 n=1 Tax=Nothobranchius furzeri TaxID=105023 RepID=A0A8C6Q328_NOTFU